MSRKILDLHEYGVHLVCIKTDDKYNPYRVIRLYDGDAHRRTLVKYGDIISVLYFLTDFYREGLDTMTLAEQIQWIKERTM